MSDKGRFTSRVHVYTKLLGYTDYTKAKEWAEEFNSPTFKIVGLKGKGELIPDYDADIVILDSDLAVKSTIVAGETVYDR